VAKEIIEMGKLPMFYRNKRQGAKKTFARLVGRQHSEHRWRNSGLAKFLRAHFNEDKPTAELEGSKQKLHTATPWYDFERLYRICVTKELHPATTGSPLSQELALIPNLQERIRRAMKLISKKGSLRAKLLEQVRRSSGENKRYVKLAIQNLHSELRTLSQAA